MDKPAIATILGERKVVGRLTTEHAASSYGLPVFADENGHAYNPAEIVSVPPLDGEKEEGDQSTKAEQVYRAVRPLLPSEAYPHIDALAAAGLLDALSVEQAAIIVHIIQAAYRAGQTSRGAEKIDNDFVWLDGVGGLERQPDATWKLVAPDGGAVQAAAAELGRRGGSATTEAKRAASAANGRKGGRPRKS